MTKHPVRAALLGYYGLYDSPYLHDPCPSYFVAVDPSSVIDVGTNPNEYQLIQTAPDVDNQHTVVTTSTIDTTITTDKTSLDIGVRSTALQRARSLVPPKAQAVQYGESEHDEFWQQHGDLLRTAWSEWEHDQQQQQQKEHDLTSSTKAGELFVPNLCNASFLLHPALYDAIQTAWNNPSPNNEAIVRNLWTEVVPHEQVYQGPFLTADGIRHIRHHLDAAIGPLTVDGNGTGSFHHLQCRGDSNGAGIPFRRPNGMNRYGCIVDNQTDGAVTTTALMEFQAWLVQDVVRPLGRLFFPAYIQSEADDAESYAFVIRYGSGHDVKLAEHSDASVVTLNLNLNLPHETYEGSSIYFVTEASTHDADKGNMFDAHGVSSVENENIYLDWNQTGPGMALLHRGSTRHAAMPIQSGQRCNLVVWLFGTGGYVRIAPYHDEKQREQAMTARQRWSKPTKSKCGIGMT